MSESEGVIEGWGPPEETDNDLRRRIQQEEAEKRRQRRNVTLIPDGGTPIKSVSKPSKTYIEAKRQQRAVDDLMKARMGKNWGRR